MNDKEMFASALQSALFADISEYERLPDIKTSRRFERRMKKLLRTHQPEIRLSDTRPPPRRVVKYAVLVALLAVVLTGATLAVYRLWETYKVKDHSLYSMLYITDIENAPKTLEERYMLGADMSGYDLEIIFQDETCNMINYSKPSGDIVISITFSQATKEFSESMFLNTEDAIEHPTEIIVNGYQGIYLETYNSIKTLIFDVGNYIIVLDGYGISKNELISIAETVQKVE